MNLNEIYIVSKDCEVSEITTDTLEKHFNTQLPSGYVEFIKTFGCGVLNEFVRIYTPEKIINELEPEFRPRWDKYYFWDNNPELTKEQVLESIIIGDTMNGDEIIFHPDSPNDIYLLPRYDETLPRIGNGLNDALTWIFNDNLSSRVKKHHFRSFDSLAGLLARNGTLQDYENYRALFLNLTKDMLILEDLNGVIENDEKIYFFHVLVSNNGFQIKTSFINNIDTNNEIIVNIITDKEQPSEFYNNLLNILISDNFESIQD